MNCCIKHSHFSLKDKSWCGKKLETFDWAFNDLDHAAYNQNHMSVSVCPECIQAACEVLTGLKKIEIK